MSREGELQHSFDIQAQGEQQDMPQLLEAIRKRFRDKYQSFITGEMTRKNEDGSETTIVSYELVFDPMERKERREKVTDTN